MDIFDQKRENRSLTSLIFDKLREDILNGVYASGDKLAEVKLAESMGVSRTPVREALKQLELDGLVENIPNRGVVVKGISHDDIEDILTIRLCVEGLVGTWAAERITAAELREIEDVYELMEFYATKGDLDKIFEQNTRFHEILYRATKSRYLESMLRDFQLFIKQARSRSLKSEGRLPFALEEHRRILLALKSRDAQATSRALSAHVEASNANIKTLFRR